MQKLFCLTFYDKRMAVAFDNVRVTLFLAISGRYKPGSIGNLIHFQYFYGSSIQIYIENGRIISA